MKYGLVILLLAGCLLPLVTAGPIQSQKKNDEELTNLIKQFVETQRTFDSDTMGKLLAADYVEVSPAGDVDEREKVLGFYSPASKAASGAPSSIECDQFRIREYSDYASVIVRQAFVSNNVANPRPIYMRASFLCRKEQGRWVISSAQYTGIRQQPPKS